MSHLQKRGLFKGHEDGTCRQRSVGSRGGGVLHDGFGLLVLTQQAAALVRKSLASQVVALLTQMRTIFYVSTALKFTPWHVVLSPM